LNSIGAKQFLFKADHCAEILEFTFTEPETKIQLHGKSFRSFSQADSLSTIVEELSTNRNVGTTAKVTSSKESTVVMDKVNLTTRKPQRKKLLDLDSEDDEDVSDTPLVPEPELNFAVNVSLDEIKKAFGASEELLVAQPMKSDETIAIDEEDFGKDSIASFYVNNLL
jgi:hypothetical protein